MSDIFKTDEKGRTWIIGEKLIFRPMDEGDTDLIIGWRNQEHVRKYFIYQQPFTREGHQKWTQSMLDTGKGYQFVLCEKESDGRAGRPVGSSYLRDINYGFAWGEYGMYIGVEDVRGRGYGREAAFYTIEFAFRVLGLHKVVSRILADNVASLRSCENAGMVREAYLKDEIKLAGAFRDLVLVAKIDRAGESAIQTS